MSTKSSNLVADYAVGRTKEISMKTALRTLSSFWLCHWKPWASQFWQWM